MLLDWNLDELSLPTWKTHPSGRGCNHQEPFATLWKNTTYDRPGKRWVFLRQLSLLEAQTCHLPNEVLDYKAPTVPFFPSLLHGVHFLNFFGALLLYFKMICSFSPKKLRTLTMSVYPEIARDKTRLLAASETQPITVESRKTQDTSHPTVEGLIQP